MNWRFVSSAAVSMFLATILVSCNNNQQTPPSATTTANSAQKGVDPATAGSISGVVKLDGEPPRMKIINMAAEPACAKEHKTPPMTQDVVLGENGTLQNVVVYLQGNFNQYSFPEPQTPVTIDQKGCMYDPHVLALRTGQKLDVVNSDPVTHNIHPVPKDNREWNQSQPPDAPAIMQSFAREEVAIPVKCNIHPWMKAYIAVLNNPYFQVTGEDGSFDLKDIPPGTYMLIAWHELYGRTEQNITLGPKESKVVTFTFDARSTVGG